METQLSVDQMGSIYGEDVDDSFQDARTKELFAQLDVSANDLKERRAFDAARF